MSDKIKVFKNPSELAEKLAEEFIHYVDNKSTLNIALAGGSTPKLLYETLAKHSNEIDWSKIHFYWGDERCVSPDHSDSNYLMTKTALLDYIDTPTENIHRLLGEDVPENEARRYDNEIKSNIPSLKFDWIFLGLGTDGHTASLFPNTENLKNTTDLCVVAEHPESGQNRISFTFSILEKADRISFLVTGSNKKDVIHKILVDKIVSDEYPVSLLFNKRKDIEWWTDENAVSGLS